MDEESGEELEPEDAPRINPWLIIGLRIALVALVVVLGIVVVGKIAVAQFHLHDSDTGTTAIGGPVPVSPISEGAPSGTSSPSPTVAVTDSSGFPTLNAPPAPTDIPKAVAMPPGLVLQVTPATIGSGQSFTVSGTYAGRDGVQLRLQRLEDGIWADYPNNIVVTMGTYSTIASSTMAGTNSFRTYDQSTGRSSNVVSVLVR